ncbi:MAG: polysaccharide pyruvyl transferase family protein [Bacteroidales bacterium]|nr:polysaccharide pyruvyl transferase family protein [Bacteroidales bacterium]
MKYLENRGYDTEIIDYRPDYLTYKLWAIGPRWDKNIFLRVIYFAYVVPRRLLMYKRRRKFDLFTASRLKLTPRVYRSIEDLRFDPPQADIFFAGSDQIWNTESPNGKDPAFYLEFAPNCSIKASYAASFSTSDIAQGLVKFVASRLKRFDFISVREDTGLKILNKLGVEGGSVVVDPVFLLNRTEWEYLSKQVTDGKYIFIYDQENNHLIKESALKLSKAYNLKIYAIESLYPISYADKTFKNAGPEEFLGLIHNCEICLTNSFHCMSFSLIFNKKFYLFRRTHQKVNSRMIDLLNYLNLSDHIAKESLENINNDAIKFQEVFDLLEKRKENSVDYIDMVISSAEVNG